MSSCSGSRPNSSARSLPGGAVKLLYMHVLVVTILTLHVFRLAINSQNSWRLRCWQDSFHKNTGKWAFNEYLLESGSHRWGNIHPYILYIRNAIRNVSSMPHGSSSQDSSLHFTGLGVCLYGWWGCGEADGGHSKINETKRLFQKVLSHCELPDFVTHFCRL